MGWETLSVDEQAGGLWIHSTNILKELFYIPTCIQPKAQPHLQQLLWMDRLLKC